MDDKSIQGPLVRSDFVSLLVAAGLFLAVGASALHFWLVEYTLPSSYYAHAPLIPLMASWMLWSERQRIAQAPKKPNLFALLLFAPSVILLVIASKISANAVMSLTLLTTFWGGVWFVFGSAFIRAAWFPLAFLALMMPFPGPVLNDLTRGLQSLSTAGAAILLNLITFHNVRTGYQIAMENFVLFVDVPCSGFKTLLALITFNAFFARMLDGSSAKRILLFLTCLPLALAINVVRIALIGIVGESVGDAAAHVFHDYSGLITLVLGFIVLFTAARMFGCRKFAGLPIF